MMADEEPSPGNIFSKSIGQSIGQSLRNLEDEVNEEAEEEPEEKPSGKQALFGDREKRMQAALQAELDDEPDEDGEGGGFEQGPENPNPLNLYQEDFEKSVWTIQVEKNSNWFSGNYLPDEMTIAFADLENGKVEYAKDPFTGGKWYISGNSVYFERQPFKVLNVAGPGIQYFRASMEGWCNDGMQMECAGYVSGYSPLFPTSVLGRFLMTKQKTITVEEKEKRLKKTKREMREDSGGLFLSSFDDEDEDGEESDVPKPKPKKVMDLSEDLTDEQQLRKEASEWVPSSISTAQKSNMDGLTKSLERLAGTVEETARRNFSQDPDTKSK